MKLSISAILTFLPLAASSLNKKVISYNNNIEQDAPIWKKGEISDYIRELRQLKRDLHASNNTISFNMKSLYKVPNCNKSDDMYAELLAKRVLAFVEAVEKYGFEIGGAICMLLEYLLWDIYICTADTLTATLMDSDNIEIKAAILSVRGKNQNFWETYYNILKVDERLQRRLLELIEVDTVSDYISIFNHWGNSLINSDEPFDIFFAAQKNCPKISFPFYVKYSLKYRGFRPNEIVKEFLGTADFDKLLSSLVSNYVPSELSIELDAQFAIALYSANLVGQAHTILSKSYFRQVPNGENRLLKSGSKYVPQFLEDKFILTASTWNIKTIYSIDLSKIEVVERLLRLGYFESSIHLNIFRKSNSNESIINLGALASLLVLDIIRHPIKYRGAAAKLDHLIELCRVIIDECNISFTVYNPVFAALDCSFDGGDIVDFSCTRFYGSFIPQLRLLLQKEQEGRDVSYYCQEIASRFALYKLIGNLEFYSLRMGFWYQVPRAYKDDKFYSQIMGEYCNLSEKEIWKHLVCNLSKPKNYLKSN